MSLRQVDPEADVRRTVASGDNAENVVEASDPNVDVMSPRQAELARTPLLPPSVAYLLIIER